MRLTEPQVRLLRNLSNGERETFGFKDMAAYGETAGALRKRGLIAGRANAHQISPQGCEALAEHQRKAINFEGKTR